MGPGLRSIATVTYSAHSGLGPAIPMAPRPPTSTPDLYLSAIRTSTVPAGQPGLALGECAEDALVADGEQAGQPKREWGQSYELASAAGDAGVGGETALPLDRW